MLDLDGNIYLLTLILLVSDVLGPAKIVRSAETGQCFIFPSKIVIFRRRVWAHTPVLKSIMSVETAEFRFILIPIVSKTAATED